VQSLADEELDGLHDPEGHSMQLSADTEPLASK